MTDFAKKLQYLMNLKGYRPADVVEASKPFWDRYKTEITRQDMSNYLKNNTRPKSNKLLCLCKTFQVEPEYFTIEDDMSLPEMEFTLEELRLVKGWRKCNDSEKDMIRYIMTNNGVILSNESKNAV